MKHLSHILLILVMLWTSAVSYATYSEDIRYDNISQEKASYTNPKATYLHTTIGLGVEFLDEDALSPDLRRKAHICALALSLPDLAMHLGSVVKKSKSLRDAPKFNIRYEGYSLRLAAWTSAVSDTAQCKNKDAQDNKNNVWKYKFSSQVQNKFKQSCPTHSLRLSEFIPLHIDSTKCH